MNEPEPGGNAAGGVVSHYKIVQKLHAGGMGEVFLAEDEVLPRVVALKLLPEASHADELLKLRFMREARAASVLSHPNIARILEAGEANGRLFIAMEYVDGSSLAEQIQRAAMSIDEILAVALQLVSAVDDAHTHGIIHRDLKPSNVMLNTRNEVKVLDFGLAKFTEPEAVDITQWKTETGTVMGTPPYMSPEQALGKEADQRSDIFSIGVIFYQLVARRLPFAGATTTDTLFRIVNTQPEPMARFNYELPIELERIVRKCLEKTPDRRYQTAADLLVDLRNFDRDRSLNINPDTVPNRGRVTSKQAKTAVGATTLLLAAIAAIALWHRNAVPPPPVVHSLAVLPFESVGGRDLDDVGGGIADLVISDLAQLPGLRVMARTTSFGYRGTESPASAGDALRVDAVLTGKIEMSGDRVIVSTELVNVSDGSRAGGARFERPLSEIATVASAISDDVTRSLNIARRSRPPAPINAEAYRLYLRGRQQWNTRTPDGLRSAIDLFRQTIEVEPRFAPAYAGLADSYSLLERYAGVPNAESRTRALAAAEHAVQLDPWLPEAHASLASVRETYSWDWAGAESEYRTAIRLSPSYATAHHWHALLLARLGHFAEAREEIAVARELDPLSPAIAAAVANVDYYAGDYPRSIDEARAALKLKGDYTWARVQLALSLAMAGNTAEGLRELQPLRAVDPAAAAADAMIRARSGDVESARAFLRAAESRKEAAAYAYALAAVHATANDRAGALQWLNTAAEAHSSWLGYLAVDPAFASLRGDPDFVNLLTKVGLPSHAS